MAIRNINSLCIILWFRQSVHWRNLKRILTQNTLLGTKGTRVNEKDVKLLREEQRNIINLVSFSHLQYFPFNIDKFSMKRKKKITLILVSHRKYLPKNGYERTTTKSLHIEYILYYKSTDGKICIHKVLFFINKLCQQSIKTHKTIQAN